MKTLSREEMKQILGGSGPCTVTSDCKGACFEPPTIEPVGFVCINGLCTWSTCPFPP